MKILSTQTPDLYASAPYGEHDKINWDGVAEELKKNWSLDVIQPDELGEFGPALQSLYFYCENGKTIPGENIPEDVKPILNNLPKIVELSRKLRHFDEDTKYVTENKDNPAIKNIIRKYAIRRIVSISKDFGEIFGVQTTKEILYEFNKMVEFVMDGFGQENVKSDMTSKELYIRTILGIVDENYGGGCDVLGLIDTYQKTLEAKQNLLKKITDLKKRKSKSTEFQSSIIRKIRVYCKNFKELCNNFYEELFKTDVENIRNGGGPFSEKLANICESGYREKLARRIKGNLTYLSRIGAVEKQKDGSYKLDQKFINLGSLASMG